MQHYKSPQLFFGTPHDDKPAQETQAFWLYMTLTNQESGTYRRRAEPTHLHGSAAYARPMNFDQIAARGNKLLRYIETPSAQLDATLDLDKKYQPQRFTYEDLTKYGWAAVPEPSVDSPGKLTPLYDVPAIAEMLRGSECHGIDAHHSNDYKVRNPESVLQTFEASRASYSTVFSPGSGVIIATLTESPRHAIRRQELDVPAPALGHWSDISFLLYQDLCKRTTPETSVRGLKHVFRSSISNEKTLSIIKPILQRRGVDVVRLERTGWAQRQTFDADTEEGRALVASPNGRGVVWMLLRYRAELGWKRVKRISIFGMGETTIKQGVGLYFELEDVQERPERGG